MFLRTILFIGIHLLYLTNVANPMVLLTANVEDIKKIARKFLSDNVADTIAEFLIKATGGWRKNKDQISEENDKNQQDINNISAEENVGRAGKQRQMTRAKEFVAYDVKTTDRHNNKISPGSNVYNTPAYESNVDRLEVIIDEDFRTDSTANRQMKQERDLDGQRMNEAKNEKYHETNDDGQIKQERDLDRQRIYEAKDEKYHETNDYRQTKQERDLDRQRIYEAKDEKYHETNDDRPIKQEKNLGRQRTSEDNDVKYHEANDDRQMNQERDLGRQRTNEYNDVKYDETTTEGGDQYGAEIEKPRKPEYNAYEEQESLPKYTSSQYSKNGKNRLIATSGSIILPRLTDGSQE